MWDLMYRKVENIRIIKMWRIKMIMKNIKGKELQIHK